MLRSNAAKQWKPDPPGKLLMERIIRYDLAAQRASQHLRLCDQHVLQPTWDQTQAEFQGDPIRYPSVMAPVENPKERKSFQLKCEKFCFPESRAHLEDRDYVLMYFAAQAGMQSLFAQDCREHPYGAEIEYRANAHVVKLSREAGDFDSTAASNNPLPPKPIALLDAKIRCRNGSGRIVECTVVDCGTSAINGDYYVLEDIDGMKRQVTADELHEIRVD